MSASHLLQTLTGDPCGALGFPLLRNLMRKSWRKMEKSVDFIQPMILVDLKRKVREDIGGVHLSQGLSLPLEQVSESLRARVWAQAEKKSRCHGRVKPGRMVIGHLSAQPRLDEAGLEERALNSRESRLDPPQDSKAPWKRSSILKRSNSSSIASSSRGVRCWSTWGKELRSHWETKKM